MFTDSPRGFTLIELGVAVAVVAILASLAVGTVRGLLPGYRAGSAAQRFLVDLRQAAAVGARANRPAHVVIGAPGEGCGGPSYRLLVGEDPSAPEAVLETVCVGAEYPGIALGAGGATAPVACGADAGQEPLPLCSLCAPGSRVTLFPTGETAAIDAAGAPVAEGHSIVFTPARSPRPQEVHAVGIRTGTGRARVYRRDDASATGWSCP